MVRDEEIKKLSDKVGQEIGSGYPADGITRAYVKGYFNEHKEFPYFVRRTWKTTEDIIAEVTNGMPAKSETTTEQTEEKPVEEPKIIEEAPITTPVKSKRRSAKRE